MSSPHPAPPGTPTAGPPSRRRDRTHYLYLAVVAAVLAGIAVGILAPDAAVELKPLGTGFVALIRMMISRSSSARSSWASGRSARPRRSARWAAWPSATSS
jgi:hypothetical protein